MSCYCNSEIEFVACCEPLILGKRFAQSALELMRSRYSAYCIKNIHYILETTHPNFQKYYSEKNIRAWANESCFTSLQIISYTENKVQFEAVYTDKVGKTHVHLEISSFEEINSRWYFTKGS